MIIGTIVDYMAVSRNSGVLLVVVLIMRVLYYLGCILGLVVYGNSRLSAQRVPRIQGPSKLEGSRIVKWLPLRVSGP